MTISTDLYLALKSWWTEANSDRPDPEVRAFGLCNWVRRYSKSCAADHEMSELFNMEFGNYTCPFGTADRPYYRDKAKHTCPRRRAWVQAKLEQYEQERRR